jgi:hypothetical protein
MTTSAGPSVAYPRPVPHDPTPEPAGALPALTACSLCAGETLEPAVDTAGRQAARLRALAERGSARLTWVECLDECERGDVVVARPTAAHRRGGARPVWFEQLAGDGPTQDLEDWLVQGGPGAVPLPTALETRTIERTPAPGSA